MKKNYSRYKEGKSKFAVMNGLKSKIFKRHITSKIFLHSVDRTDVQTYPNCKE